MLKKFVVWSLPFLLFCFSNFSLAQEIEVLQSSTPYPAWTYQALTIRYVNNTTQALFLSHYEISNDKETLYQENLGTTHLGEVQENQYQVSLEVIFDDPGAQARLPYPPVVKPLGKSSFSELPRILPGESYQVHPSFLAHYGWKLPLKIQAHFYQGTLPVFHLTKIEKKEDDTPPVSAFPQAVKTTVFYSFYYEEKEAPSLEEALTLMPFERSYFPARTLVSEEALKQLPQLEKNVAFSCTLKTPSFDLDQALMLHMERSKKVSLLYEGKDIPSRMNYLIHGELWWYVDNVPVAEGSPQLFETHLIGKSLEYSLEGDWSTLFLEANRKAPSDKLYFLVYHYFHKQDFQEAVVDTLLKRLHQLNYPVRKKELKGGGCEWEAEVEVLRLIPFQMEMSFLKASLKDKPSEELPK
jgi:hypothetical protein